MSQSIQNKDTRVARRFDGETQIWDDVHSSNILEIIQWEVHRRKEITREHLVRNFKGQSLSILEIGCGSGKNLDAFVSCDPAWIGHGVDISRGMVDYCRSTLGDRQNLSFEVLDIQKDRQDRTFDVIILLGVVGYFSSNESAFHNISAMLKPGGHLVFTHGKRPSITRFIRRLKQKLRNQIHRRLNVNTERSEDGSDDLFQCYSTEELRALLPSAWKVIRLNNLAFGAGLLGRLSVLIGRVLEKVFIQSDPFNLALTTLVFLRRPAD